MNKYPCKINSISDALNWSMVGLWFKTPFFQLLSRCFSHACLKSCGQLEVYDSMVQSNVYLSASFELFEATWCCLTIETPILSNSS